MGDATVDSLIEQMRDLPFGTSGNLKAARVLMKKTPRDVRKKMAELASEEGGYIQKAFGDVFHYNENAKRYVDRDRRKICMENKVMMANAFGGVKSISRESGKSGKAQRSMSRARSLGMDEAEFGSSKRDRQSSGKRDRQSSGKRDRHRSKDREEFGKHERRSSGSKRHRHSHSRHKDREELSRFGEREHARSRHEDKHKRSRHREHNRDRSRHRDR